MLGRGNWKHTPVCYLKNYAKRQDPDVMMQRYYASSCLTETTSLIFPYNFSNEIYKCIYFPVFQTKEKYFI